VRPGFHATVGGGLRPPANKRTRPYEESVAGRSELDAMGNDKRRQVIGGQYGATVRKRLLVYGVAVAVIVGAVILSLTVVSSVDNKDIRPQRPQGHHPERRHRQPVTPATA
jgi:hypothetical protein